MRVKLSVPRGGPSIAAGNGAVAGLTPKFIRVDGRQARYYDMGRGEPLVLLHGGAGGSPNSANIWSKNLTGLTGSFRVVALDRLGFGMTAGSVAERDDYQLQVEFLHQFLRALKLKFVHLAGHSAGNGVAFFFAVAHPQMVKTLTLISAGMATPLDWRHQRMHSLLKKCPEQPVFEAWKCRIRLLSSHPDTTFDNEFWEAQRSMDSWRVSHEPSFAKSARHPLRMRVFASRLLALQKRSWNRARAGALGHMPLLIYYGKDEPLDWLMDDETAQLQGGLALFDLLAAKNPNVKMTVLNEAGHFVYRDRPGTFNHDLAGFIHEWTHSRSSVSSRRTRATS